MREFRLYLKVNLKCFGEIKLIYGVRGKTRGGENESICSSYCFSFYSHLIIERALGTVFAHLVIGLWRVLK